MKMKRVVYSRVLTTSSCNNLSPFEGLNLNYPLSLGCFSSFLQPSLTVFLSFPGRLSNVVEIATCWYKPQGHLPILNPCTPRL